MSEFYSFDRENLDAKTIDLYCRWLYQTARADGKPRVLHFGSFYVTPISRFIDRLKQVKATRWLKNICFLGFSHSHKLCHFLHPN
jgi:hypothetical protein